jgi:membrane associated rhomboid family serine protease
MLPLKSDAHPAHFPPVTVFIIVICALIFVFEMNVPRHGGFVPLDFMHALFHPAELGSALTALFWAFFLHANLVHLVSNMWFLWIFGGALEHEVGSRSFVVLYLVCGVLSLVLQAATTPLSTIPIIGASGAIAGVMGAYLLLLPFSKIVLWVPPLFFPRLPAFVVLLAWAALQYWSMSAGHSSEPVAWWAHLGGFFCGFLFAFLLKNRVVVQPRSGSTRKPLPRPRRKRV